MQRAWQITSEIALWIMVFENMILSMIFLDDDDQRAGQRSPWQLASAHPAAYILQSTHRVRTLACFSLWQRVPHQHPSFHTTTHVFYIMRNHLGPPASPIPLSMCPPSGPPLIVASSSDPPPPG